VGKCEGGWGKSGTRVVDASESFTPPVRRGECEGGVQVGVGVGLGAGTGLVMRVRGVACNGACGWLGVWSGCSMLIAVVAWKGAVAAAAATAAAADAAAV